MPNYVEKSRHGLYYLRLPSRLAHLSGGKRISLQTYSKRLAISRARSHISQMEQMMRAAMSHTPHNQEEFAFEDAVQSLANDLDAENAQLDAILRGHPDPGVSEAIGLVIQKRLRNVMLQQASALMSEQIRAGYLAPGLTLDDQHQIFHNLFQFADNVTIEVNGSRSADGSLSLTSLAKAKTSYKEALYATYLDLCDAARPSPAYTPSKLQQASDAQACDGLKVEKSHTLLDLYYRWKAKQNSLNGETSFSTDMEYERHANVLSVISGHLAIEKFTTDDFETLHLRTLDMKAYASTGIQRSALTIDTLIPASSEYTKISPETASGYSRRLTALHLFAFQQGLTSIDPKLIQVPKFGKLTSNVKKKIPLDDSPNKTYKTSELQAIFDGWIYKPTNIHKNMSVYPYQFWMPLIAVYSGMRISEISGLTTKDIVEREGVWCIKIEENEEIGRRVKTLSSKRIVPIHSKLRELGFLDYFTSRIKSKSTMLFDGLTFNKKNGWGHGPSTFFTRVPSKSSPGAGYFYKIGIHNSAHDGRDVHSFRHTLIDQLRSCGLPHSLVPHIIESISGHQKKKKTEADHYGDGIPLVQRAEFLEYAKYEGLDLNHVSYRTFQEAYSANLQRSLEKFNTHRFE